MFFFIPLGKTVDTIVPEDHWLYDLPQPRGRHIASVDAFFPPETCRESLGSGAKMTNESHNQHTMATKYKREADLSLVRHRDLGNTGHKSITWPLLADANSGHIIMQGALRNSKSMKTGLE